jgi:hypothetical protein
MGFFQNLAYKIPVDSIAEAMRQKRLQKMPPAENVQAMQSPPINMSAIEAKAAEPSGFFSQQPMQAMPQQAPDPLEQYLQPGTAQQRYQSMIESGPEKAGGGFFSRLKSAGLGFLINGLPGAVAGGISPQLIKNIQHQMGLHQMGDLARQESGLRNTQFDNLAQLRQMREQERYRQAQLENVANDNRFNQQRLGFDREKEGRLQKEQAADNQRAAEQQLYGRREGMAKLGGERIGMADLFTPTAQTSNRGMVLPIGQGEAYRLPSQQQEQARALEKARAVGEANVNNQVKAQALLAPGKILEGDVAEERAVRREDRREGVREQKETEKQEGARVKEAKNTSIKIQTLINRAAKQFEEAKGIADPEKRAAKEAAAQGDKDSADREIEIAKQLYPDLIEGGLGDGDFPYVKFKEPTAAATKPAKGALSTQAGNYKTGQVVKYKGQRHRILRFENGNPVLDPTPIQ